MSPPHQFILRDGGSSRGIMLRRSFLCQSVSDHLAAFHHKLHVFQCCHIGQQVA
jgi:hypothetical protein